MKIAAAFFLFFIAFMYLMIYLVGMHRHLKFRLHMTANQIISGIAAVSFLSGLVLLIKGSMGRKPIKQRQFGSAKGFFIMHDNFDEPLQDFKDYM
jgi:hypothetical protein